ncbi:MAG: hypothetical protein GY937_20985 [bacterium]|nr:hypothetical protein [bacterium]
MPIRNRPSTAARTFHVVGVFIVGVLATAAAAQPLSGDLDGDGTVSASDEALLQGLYGAVLGDASYDPAADVNADGKIDHRDLALFGSAFGSTGGDPDTSAPSLLVTLNDIPDDQNDLLVVPPDAFQVTLGFDSAGGSVVDRSTLSVTWSEDVEGYPSGSELAALFSSSPTRGFYEVPAGSDLPRTSHYLTVSIEDAAGNQNQQVYGFAVRDFGLGAPMGSQQQIFLDFDQDRSLGTEIDFLEDLREFGLSSTADLVLESQVRDRIVSEILERAHTLYGRNADGSPGTDPVNIVFSDSAPGGAYARLCVGGESPTSSIYLGLTPLDEGNLADNENTCTSAQYGVFPQAIDNLWASEASYQQLFTPVDPDLGGTPIGENPLDSVVLDTGFDPNQATSAQLARWSDVEAAITDFSSLLGTVVAHETGHLLGLTAHGAPPAGLYGGTSGSNADHNVTSSGTTPTENFVMNAGGSFSFDEVTGGGGQPLPAFRPLSWAYLRDRVALNSLVTGLFSPPVLSQVPPNPATYPMGLYTVDITISGADFMATPSIRVLREGSPTWDVVNNVVFVDPQTLTGTLNSFVVIADPNPYDVRVTNPDGQLIELLDHLLVTQE